MRIPILVVLESKGSGNRKFDCRGYVHEDIVNSRTPKGIEVDDNLFTLEIISQKECENIRKMTGPLSTNYAYVNQRTLYEANMKQ